MGRVQRTSLILAAAVGSVAGAPAHAPNAAVRLIAGDSGTLRIMSGARKVAIAPVIVVEQADGHEWREAGEIDAIDHCGDVDSDVDGAPVRLAPAQVLDVVRWRGWTCEAQCPRLCGVNIYLGPGIFRFVAKLVPRGGRVASNSFVMPDRNAAR